MPRGQRADSVAEAQLGFNGGAVHRQSDCPHGPFRAQLAIAHSSFRFRVPSGRSTEMATSASTAMTAGRKPLRARPTSSPCVVSRKQSMRFWTVQSRRDKRRRLSGVIGSDGGLVKPDSRAANTIEEAFRALRGSPMHSSAPRGHDRHSATRSARK